MPPHAYAPQLRATSAHAPEPLQYDGCVSTPAAQAAPLHAVVTGGKEQLPLVPLHWCPQAVPAPAPGHAGRSGAGVPARIWQAPTAPGRLHDSHWPPHARLQHTPSTQTPLVHCSAAVHVAPFAARAAHLPPVQKLPAAHSLVVAQPVAHAPATHAA